MPMHISDTPIEVSQHLAAWISQLIQETVSRHGAFTWALSGGSTPKMLYELLAEEPYRSHIPWDKVHLFWGDERFVPLEDSRNNARMAFDTLIDHVGVPKHQVHIMRTDLKPEEAVASYTQLLHQYFTEDGKTFDLTLLGMGDDGHTLSLFPGQPIVHEIQAWVSAYFLKAQDMYRITLTAPVVNRSEHVVFLVCGSSKAAALKQVLEGPYQPDTYPSQVIKPVHGQLHWFLDRAATASLSKSA